MIAGQIKGKDIYGLLAYHEKKAAEGKGYFLDANISYGKTFSMTKEFNLIRQLRSGLNKTVYHVSLNLPNEDNMPDIEFILLGWDYLQGMGLMITNTSCTGMSTKSTSTSTSLYCAKINGQQPS